MGKGGQSALRFARLRLEKRQNYVRKVAQLCQRLLIDSNTNMPNVRVLPVCRLVCPFVHQFLKETTLTYTTGLLVFIPGRGYCCCRLCGTETPTHAGFQV